MTTQMVFGPESSASLFLSLSLRASTSRIEYCCSGLDLTNTVIYTVYRLVLSLAHYVFFSAHLISALAVINSFPQSLTLSWGVFAHHPCVSQDLCGPHIV
jgi:hypothetical protein